MSSLTLPHLEVANAHFLTPRLLTGGDLHHDLSRALDQLDELVGAGVTHVIDNRMEWSDEDLVADHAPHVGYLHNGVDDAGQRMPDSWFERGVTFALDAWRADPSAIVVAHCHMGINRGPSMAYAILLALGWDAVDAIDRIRRERGIAAVGYAEDALDWHLRLVGADERERRGQRRRLADWRARNRIDVVRIIRDIRAGEA